MFFSVTILTTAVVNLFRNSCIVWLLRHSPSNDKQITTLKRTDIRNEDVSYFKPFRYSCRYLFVMNSIYIYVRVLWKTLANFANFFLILYTYLYIASYSLLKCKTNTLTNQKQPILYSWKGGAAIAGIYSGFVHERAKLEWHLFCGGRSENPDWRNNFSQKCKIKILNAKKYALMQFFEITFPLRDGPSHFWGMGEGGVQLPKQNSSTTWMWKKASCTNHKPQKKSYKALS